ncbi:Uncharacterised protein [Rodentibacter pneumotropicus]|nr:Uncharacterised protein [Rodentibacter pneumotropicus]
MNYATYQFKKFRTAIGSVESLNNQYCQILRTQARDDLDVVKGQYKNGMVDNSKNEDGTSKNTDGVATNQNKFFFDIIKWGSALLL